MEETVFTKMSVHELKDLIINCVSEAFNEQSKLNSKQEEETLLTVAELSKYLGVSKVTIHTWKREGKLPFYTMGRRVYFKKSEILRGY